MTTRTALSTAAIILAGATLARAQAAAISSITPASATYGESVTITGVGFGGPTAQIRVGGVPAKVVTVTGSRATFRVPLGVPIGRTTVTITNPGGRSTGSIGFDVSGAVYLTLDNNHAATAAIGSDGGVITAESNGRT